MTIPDQSKLILKQADETDLPKKLVDKVGLGLNVVWDVIFIPFEWQDCRNEPSLRTDGLCNQFRRSLF
jgi:hypothetical protein